MDELASSSTQLAELGRQAWLTLPKSPCGLLAGATLSTCCATKVLGRPSIPHLLILPAKT
jgi:hypothetical protein